MSILEQVKDLDQGKGIQYLLDSAFRIFDSPVYVIDSFYNLIAYSGLPADDPIWHDLVRTGTFSAYAMELMASENVARDVSYSDKITRLMSDKWEHGLISGHIFNGDNIWIGQTTISENTHFDVDKMAAFELLIDKISREIHDYEYFTRLPNIFFENALNMLLDKTIENTLVNNSQAQIMHYGMERFLYVAVVSVARNNILESIHQNRLAYFQSLLKTWYKSFRYTIHEGQIVMLMSSKLGNYHEAMPLGRDYSLFEHNRMHAGISGSFENIYEFRKYYDQAIATLNEGMESKSGEWIFLA